MEETKEVNDCEYCPYFYQARGSEGTGDFCTHLESQLENQGRNRRLNPLYDVPAPTWCPL